MLGLEHEERGEVELFLEVDFLAVN